MNLFSVFAGFRQDGGQSAFIHHDIEMFQIKHFVQARIKMDAISGTE